MHGLNPDSTKPIPIPKPPASLAYLTSLDRLDGSP